MDKLLVLWAQSIVVLNGQASDPVPVISGVPQGSVLRLLLFLILINDIPDNIKSSIRLILQEDLDSLALWEADWQVQFDVAKCRSMRVILID